MAHSVSRIAEAVGISQRDLARMVATQLGKILQKKSGDYLISKTHLKRLKWPVPIDLEAVAAMSLYEPEKKAAGPDGAEPVPVEVHVFRIPINDKLVICRDKTGAQYHVFVKTNSVFWVGLEMQILPHPARLGCYRPAGPVPRTRGDRAYLQAMKLTKLRGHSTE